MLLSRSTYRMGVLVQGGGTVVEQFELAYAAEVAGSNDCDDGRQLTSIEICAGAGGAALGVEQAGFRHQALVEIEPEACRTLALNRPQWNVIEGNVRKFHAHQFAGIDLLSGGVPCPPFSKAGLKQGLDDERDLFPEALRLVEECQPRAVMIENVPGLMEAGFAPYRAWITGRLEELGYLAQWRVLQASDFGVPQLRPRVLCVALRKDLIGWFHWPGPSGNPPPTVGQALAGEMGSRGWEGVAEWAQRANRIAPTLVGGSKRHGGPDLGPTRAKKAWAALGVDGHGLADAPPSPGFEGMPRLTVPMTALLQGFPSDWRLSGRKTAAYRQVGNAFPPPVARAVAAQIRHTLLAADRGLRQRAQEATHVTAGARG